MIDNSAQMPGSEPYLDSIAAPAPIRERIRTLLAAYARVVNIADADIFVSDDIDHEGNRTFSSLWVFTSSHAFEAQISAESGNRLDGTPLSSSIVHWVARSQAFEFEAADPNSRLTVEVWFSDQLLGDLSATGPNCDRLTEILRKHIIPNAS
jgi:hypothetical protein